MHTSLQMIQGMLPPNYPMGIIPKASPPAALPYPTMSSHASPDLETALASAVTAVWPMCAP